MKHPKIDGMIIVGIVSIIYCIVVTAYMYYNKNYFK